MPAITIPDEGLGSYSIGYGFNMNASYKLTEDISLSGNIEVIFSDFKYSYIFHRRNVIIMSLHTGIHSILDQSFF